MHTAVLLQEAVEGLNIKKGGLYIDATVGEAGHSLEILKRGGKVLGIDLDSEQVKSLKLKVKGYKNFKIVQGNFAEIETISKKNGFFPVDGVLFDLGLSMKQINQSGRGFSFKKPNEPLDMRISLDREQTAADIVNSYSEKELYEILARYSEELNSRPIAQAIVFQRRLKKIRTVVDLLTIIKRTLKREDEKTYRRIFQALRIAVNQELENLKQGLKGSLKILKKDGRIAVISFHSLEDRVVKNFIKKEELCQVNKKIITGRGENRFERSAKLRIISFN